MGGGRDKKGTVSKRRGSADEPRGIGIEGVVRLLNSIFRRAKVDARITEFCLAREEVVIGFPEQIESFENELRDVNLEGDVQQGGRYVASVRVISSGREVTSIVRFYKKADDSLLIEDVCDEEITLGEEEARSGSKRWEKVAEFGKSIAEIAVKTVVEMLMRQAQ